MVLVGVLLLLLPIPLALKKPLISLAVVGIEAREIPTEQRRRARSFAATVYDRA
jgi:hypothetical protein